MSVVNPGAETIPNFDAKLVRSFDAQEAARNKTGITCRHLSRAGVPNCANPNISLLQRAQAFILVSKLVRSSFLRIEIHRRYSGSDVAVLEET